MTPYPMAMQLRYLQTLTEVASERNSTIIFPLPIELLRPFLGGGTDVASAASMMNGKIGSGPFAPKEADQTDPMNGPATPLTSRATIPSVVPVAG